MDPKVINVKNYVSYELPNQALFKMKFVDDS